VWFRDQAHLESVLAGLASAGFTGKLGLSVDKFHGIQTTALADFCRTARRVFERDSIVSLSYASRHPDAGLEPVHALAREPDALAGATSNHCYFCWYVLTRGLAAGVSGGGGQVGEWTGTRPSQAGELIQIGLPKPSSDS